MATRLSEALEILRALAESDPLLDMDDGSFVECKHCEAWQKNVRGEHAPIEHKPECLYRRAVTFIEAINQQSQEVNS